jgi:hypothetical protein
MKRLGAQLLSATALLLGRGERETVLGDLAEAGESGWGGLWDVLGLVCRRQAALWLDWRPWLAAFGLALPGSLFLMGLSVSLSLAVVQMADPHAMTTSGGAGSPGFGLFVVQFLLLLAWSWSGGFVVGTLSRRTLWASIVSCVSPCLFCLSRFGIESLPRLCLLLFLLPAIAGFRRALRGSPLQRPWAVALAVGVSILVLPSWRGETHGADPRIWLFNAMMCWPAWYLAVTTRTATKPGRLAA